MLNLWTVCDLIEVTAELRNVKRARSVLISLHVSLSVVLQLVDEEFDALEGFFYVLEHGILELLENVEIYLHHLQVNRMLL